VSIQRLGIVGAGFMGSGIAEAAARAGVDVTLHEPASDPLDRSKGRIEQSVARAVKGGKLTDADAAQLMDRVAWTQ
jgi:3-hydroxybutyryl-CoA dehydrogenase